MLHLKKKLKKRSGDIIILHLCAKNLDDMIYNFSDIECDRRKQAILGHFLPFGSPKNQKNLNFENLIKIDGDIIILPMRTKNHNHVAGTSII